MWIRWAAILGAVISCAFAFGDDKAPDDSKPAGESISDAPRFVQVIRDDKDQPIQFQTATLRYSSTDPKKKGLIVDLIGVVHIGDKQYYEHLNREFKQYDALLYELVAPKGTRIPKGGRKQSGGVVSDLQVFLKNSLDLAFQLEEVDYHAPNFVHADMSPEEFSKSMTDLKETPLNMMMRIMRASVAEQVTRKRPPPNDLVVMGAFLDKKNGPLVLKRIFADQLAESDKILEAFNGSEGSTLVTARNKAALKVMEEQIAAGKKRIAIFYGAAHMTDFHERLLRDHGMKVDGNPVWATAWDLTKKPTGKKKKESESEKPSGKPGDKSAR
jgi:hypothetical protein